MTPLRLLVFCIYQTDQMLSPNESQRENQQTGGQYISLDINRWIFYTDDAKR